MQSRIDVQSTFGWVNGTPRTKKEGKTKSESSKLGVRVGNNEEGKTETYFSRALTLFLCAHTHTLFKIQ